MKLQGKTALVTGSSQGIGEAIAFRLAAEGADVVINYHSHPEQANAIIKRIQSLGRKAVSIGANLAEVAECEKLVRESADALGHLDILVNNAGVETRNSFWEVSETDYDLVMNVNAKGVFFTTRLFVQLARQTGRGGTIINVSSVHEELPFPHFAAYGMSKAAVKLLTRDLAIELAPLGIRVNSIAPGAIKTLINAKLLDNKDQINALLANIPLKRMGTPEDVAGAAAFLASDDASYITGTTIFVDGGLL
jgi:glucose 1-dehydrogenase